VPIYFPKMEENIRMGDAATALQHLDSEQEQRIRRATDLGGATEFISKLPHGLKTNFNSGTRVAQMVGPDAFDILTAVSNAKADPERKQATSLSGGQSQRLAL
jgi:ABC-type multidrug transport system fused ATPase/permease subunit